MRRTTSSLPKSRILLLRTVTVVVTVLVVARFFQLSVIDHQKALAEAKNQYGIKQVIEAKRGEIAMQDIKGGPDYPVALNIDSFMVVADPFLIHEPMTMVKLLAEPLEMPESELFPKLTDKHKRFVILKKRLVKEKAEAVEKLNLKGVTVQTVPVRYYPESTLGAHVIGFVNAEGEGKYGIEGFFDEDLKGYDGSLVGEKDAKLRIIAEGETAEPRDGTDFVLTIDHNIQYIVETKLKEAVKKFEAESGSIIVLDPKTGAILALANEPSYDLNNYNTVPASEQHVFVNNAVSNTWEPGSIFKTFTLSAGIDLGLFEPETKLDLGCFVKVNGFEIRNAEDKCYNHPTIIHVLTESINLGSIWAADKIGNDNFSTYVADFGFGSKTGIELNPESGGKVLEARKWRDVNRATISFGQGISVTPLQMVAGYAAIANSGKLMHPYVVAKRIESTGREIKTTPREVRQVIKPETAAKVTTLLEHVVTEGHGKRAAVAGYNVAGKTGTAQIVGTDGKYEENQHIGAFAGFFPSNEPRFAMLVKLDKPKAVEFAESSAAPTFGEIAKWLLNYAKVPPTEATN